MGKHVKGFGECAPFNDLALLTDVYKGTAGGAGIIQLQDGPPRVVDGIYKVLLRPKGRCWGCAPTDLTCLKAAVRGVLTGLATLHSAGKCSAQDCRGAPPRGEGWSALAAAARCPGLQGGG